MGPSLALPRLAAATTLMTLGPSGPMTSGLFTRALGTGNSLTFWSINIRENPREVPPNLSPNSCDFQNMSQYGDPRMARGASWETLETLLEDTLGLWQRLLR